MTNATSSLEPKLIETGYQKLWRFLVEPAASLRTQEVRRQVRLLSVLLLALIPLMLLGAFLSWHLGKNIWASGMLAVGTASLTFAYMLTRLRHHGLGAMLTVMICSVIPFYAFLRPDSASEHIEGSLIWIVLVVQLGTMLLPMRGLLAVIIANELVLVLLIVAGLANGTPQLIHITGFVTVVSALAWVAASHRNWLEQDRLAEILSTNRELDFLRTSLEQRVAERTTALAASNTALHKQIVASQHAAAAREQSDALFRALFEYSPDAVLLIDPHAEDGSWPIVDCNTAACRMNGYSREELIGQSIEILNANPGTVSVRMTYLEDLRAAGNLKVETNHRHRDGSIFPIEISTTLITVGGRELVLGIDRDTTKRKHIEETLRRQSSYLAALHDTTLGLLNGLEINNLLEALLHSASRLLGVSHAYIYLLRQNEQEMELKLSIGLPDIDNREFRKPDQGMVGMVWQTGQPISVNDYEQWPGRLSGLPTVSGIGAVVAAPITFASKVIGVIGLAHDKTSGLVFGDEEITLLTRFAQLAAVALDNARLLETERTARHQSETLREATQALSASLDLQTVLEIILTKLKEVVPYDSASVQEIRQDVLMIIGGVGFSNWEEIRQTTFDLTSDKRPNKEVVMTRQPLIIGSNSDERYADFHSGVHALALANVNSWMGVPLLFGEQVIGMITLDKREPEFYTADHAQIALSFAAQAAIAIYNARTYTAAQEYAAESAALYRAAAQLLNPTMDLAGLCEQIARAVTHEFSLANCSVLLLDETRTALRMLASVGAVPVGDSRLLPLSGSGLTVTAVRMGEMVYVPDVTTDPRYLAGTENTRSELVMPLRGQDGIIGVLDLQSPEPNAFDERAARIIAAFASQAEMALENMRLVANLAEAYHRLQADQEQLLAAEKMASLGRLTAGIAHEINSPLAAVRSGLGEINHLITEYRDSIGDADVTDDDHRAIALDMQKAAHLANTAAERAAAFIRSIKSQTRDTYLDEPAPFQVVPVIQDALLLLGHALRHSRSTVTFDYDADNLELRGSPGQLAQVITNLVTNAIDASMVNGGGPIQVQLMRVASGLDLRVGDEGVGIPPEILPKIFEPLFTTKPFGQGTGLGLTIIHDIVTGGFGGTIEVSSQPNHGAIFTVHFPSDQER